MSQGNEKLAQHEVGVFDRDPCPGDSLVFALERERHGLGMSRERFAVWLGVDQSTYWKVRRGQDPGMSMYRGVLVRFPHFAQKVIKSLMYWALTTWEEPEKEE